MKIDLYKCDVCGYETRNKKECQYYTFLFTKMRDGLGEYDDIYKSFDLCTDCINQILFDYLYKNCTKTSTEIDKDLIEIIKKAIERHELTGE